MDTNSLSNHEGGCPGYFGYPCAGYLAHSLKNGGLNSRGTATLTGEKGGKT